MIRKLQHLRKTRKDLCKTFCVSSMVVALLLLPVISYAAPYDSLSDRVTHLERMLDSRQDLDLMVQVQGMQQEIQVLRGQLEEANALVLQMQEQQRALYRDIDRRLASNTRPSGASYGKIQERKYDNRPVEDSKFGQTKFDATTTSRDFRSTPSELVATDEETKSYRQAYRSVVGKNYDAAQQQFLAYIDKFPSGKHLPNAYYWLGEIHLLQHNIAEAIQAFKAVVGFSDHHKVGDALLKMGYAYDEQGEMEKAKSAYMDVSRRYQGTSLARLADARLAKLRRR